MSTTLPAGIGSPAEIDQANRWKNEQPWFQDELKSMGQDPNNIHLSGQQRDQLLAELRQKGVGISDHFQIDEAGNIHAKSSLGKKILIAAAIGGVAMTGLGLAGVGPMAGMFGGAGVEAGASSGVMAGLPGASATLPSTMAATSGVMAGLPGASVAVPGMLGGVEGAATPGVMAGLPGSMATPPGMVSAAKDGTSTIDRISQMMQSLGNSIGAADQAAGNNRLDQEKLALDANQQNISGNQAFESAQMARATQEAAQRTGARKDVYRESYAQNPRVSPFDPAGAPKFSDNQLATFKNLGQQGTDMLSKPASTQIDKMAPTAPYTPIDLKNVQGATGTEQSGLSKAGDWIAPALSVGGNVLQGIYGKKPSTYDEISKFLKYLGGSR